MGSSFEESIKKDSLDLGIQKYRIFTKLAASALAQLSSFRLDN